MAKTKPASLVVTTWNADSIRHKKTELENFIKDRNIDIILLQETYLKPQDNFKIPNYQIYRKDRLNKPGGGVAIAIKNRIDHFLAENHSTANTESITVKVKINDRRTLKVTSIYIPPANNLGEDELRRIFEGGDQVLVGGDLNAKHPSWNSRRTNTKGKIIDKFIKDHHLKAVGPVVPTHISKNGANDILDIFIAKNLNKPNEISTESVLSSDHNPVTLKIGNNHTPNEPQYREFTNWEEFKQLLDETYYETSKPTNDTEIDVEIAKIEESIKKALTASTHKAQTRTRNDGFPLYIKDTIRKRNKLKRIALMTSDPTDKKEVNKLTNQIKKMVASHENRKWDGFLDSLNDPDEEQNFYKLARKMKSETRSAEKILHGLNGLVYEDEAKLEAFADSMEAQFTENPPRHKDNAFNEKILRQTNDFLAENYDVQTQPTNIDEIKTIIHGLDPKKTPGHDKTTNHILKLLPEKTLSKITDIMNACLKTSYFPKRWRHAIIAMIPKPNKDSLFPHKKKSTKSQTH